MPRVGERNHPPHLRRERLTEPRIRSANGRSQRLAGECIRVGGKRRIALRRPGKHRRKNPRPRRSSRRQLGRDGVIEGAEDLPRGPEAGTQAPRISPEVLRRKQRNRLAGEGSEWSPGLSRYCRIGVGSRLGRTGAGEQRDRRQRTRAARQTVE
jgi:hypothetical protein